MVCQNAWQREICSTLPRQNPTSSGSSSPTPTPRSSSPPRSTSLSANRRPSSMSRSVGQIDVGDFLDLVLPDLGVVPIGCLTSAPASGCQASYSTQPGHPCPDQKRVPISAAVWRPIQPWTISISRASPPLAAAFHVNTFGGDKSHQKPAARARAIIAKWHALSKPRALASPYPEPKAPDRNRCPCSAPSPFLPRRPLTGFLASACRARQVDQPPFADAGVTVGKPAFGFFGEGETFPPPPPRAMGAQVEQLAPGEWRVHGVGVSARCPASRAALDGRATRALQPASLMGLVATTRSRRHSGDASLLSRPMGWVIEPLANGRGFHASPATACQLMVTGASLPVPISTACQSPARR